MQRKAWYGNRSLAEECVTCGTVRQPGRCGVLRNHGKCGTRVSHGFAAGTPPINRSHGGYADQAGPGWRAFARLGDDAAGMVFSGARPTGCSIVVAR